MKVMRPALLNLQIWLINMDLVLTILSCPYVYFPSAAGTPLGVLSDYVGVKWQSYYGQLSVTYIGVATIVLFENRQSQIATIDWKIRRKSTRIIFYMCNYIIHIFLLLPFYMSKTDQNELRLMVLDRIPCPTQEFYDEKTYVLLRGDEIIPFYSITASLVLVLGQGIFFITHAMFHLSILKNQQLSKVTKLMQKKYLKCVLLQLTIPLLAIVFPIVYSLYADRFDYYNQAYNNIAMIAMSNHGLLSSLSALYIYKPYRDFCVEKFFGINLKFSSTGITTISVTSVMI